MKMIQPIVMTDAQLTGGNVLENDFGAYSSTTTYSEGDKCISTVTHKIYQSVTNGNSGHDPTTDDGTNWIAIGATNRWKAFDRRISDPARKTGTLRYSITPASRVTGIGFLGLDASQVRVEIYDANGAKTFDQVRKLVGTGAIFDWFSYFTFDPADSTETEALFTGIPGYSGHKIDISIGAGTGTVGVGQIVLGKSVGLGSALAGTAIGIKDYSTKGRDPFGNAVIVERPFADTTSFQFAIPVGDERRVKRELAKYTASAALYFADEIIESKGATTYGFFSGFSIPLASRGVSFASLEIEGLT